MEFPYCADGVAWAAILMPFRGVSEVPCSFGYGRCDLGRSLVLVFVGWLFCLSWVVGVHGRAGV